MTGNNFADNTAALQGGALFIVGTTTSSLGVQSSRCSLQYPASISDRAVLILPQLTCYACSFINNTAINDGGGAIYAYLLQDVMLYNTTFVGNSAGGQGGGVDSVRPSSIGVPCYYIDAFVAMYILVVAALRSTPSRALPWQRASSTVIQRNPLAGVGCMQ